jgi:hypothetical protein
MLSCIILHSAVEEQFHYVYLRSTLFTVWRHAVTLQRTNTENSKQIFPEKELRGHSPNFHIRVSVGNLYIPTIDLPVMVQEICGPIQEMYINRSQTHECGK